MISEANLAVAVAVAGRLIVARGRGRENVRGRENASETDGGVNGKEMKGEKGEYYTCYCTYPIYLICT